MAHEFRFEDLDNATYDVEQSARRVQDARGELDAIVGSGESAEGNVRITTDVSGRVLSIHLDPRAMKLGSRDLADELLVAVRRAQDDSDAQRERIMSGALGTSEWSVDSFAERSHRQFDKIVDNHRRVLDESEARLSEIIQRIEEDFE